MNNDKNIDYDYSDIDDATLEELAALILGIGKYRKDAVQPIYVVPKVKEIIEEKEVQPIIIKKAGSASTVTKKKKSTSATKEYEYTSTKESEYEFNGRQELDSESEKDGYEFNGNGADALNNGDKEFNSKSRESDVLTTANGEDALNNSGKSDTETEENERALTTVNGDSSEIDSETAENYVITESGADALNNGSAASGSDAKGNNYNIFINQEFKTEENKYAININGDLKSQSAPAIEEPKTEPASQAQHRYKFVKRNIVKNEKPVQEKKPVKNYKWIPQIAYLYLRKEETGPKLKLTLNDNPTDDIGETVLTRNVIDTMSFDEINKPTLINKPESAQKPALKPAAPKTAPAKKAQTSAAKKPVTQKPAAKKTPAKTAQKETTAPVNAKQQAKADVDAIVKKAQKKK